MMKPRKITLPLGLLEPVMYRPSNHCNDRPKNVQIDTIIVHCISLPPGKFGTNDVEHFFCGSLDVERDVFYSTITHLKVAAHLFIKRCGEIIQFVPFSQRAWHAGASHFAGRDGCNDFSIGIELEGTEDIPYEPIQYEQLSKVIKLLMKAYPFITPERIIGHADVAPGRKTDPGSSFDWAYLRGLIA